MGILDNLDDHDLTEDNIIYELQNREEPWKIKDLRTAHWADEMIHERELTIAEKEKIANDTIAALEAKIEKQKEWLERATKQEHKEIEFLLTQLKSYHMDVIDEEKELNRQLKDKGKKEKPLTKTIKLPYRDLTSKVQPPEIIRTNEEQLIKWVQDNHTTNIPLNKLVGLIEAKNSQDEKSMSVAELLVLVKEYDTNYIKREDKLAWAEWKKTLSQQEIPVITINEEGQEEVVGKKLVYFDENGSEVPFVELHPKEDKFDWKPVTE